MCYLGVSDELLVCAFRTLSHRFRDHSQAICRKPAESSSYETVWFSSPRITGTIWVSLYREWDKTSMLGYPVESTPSRPS